MEERDYGLKRCPFCGGEAKLRIHTIVWAECKDCKAGTACFDYGRGEAAVKDAIEAWNRRKQ